MVSEPAPISYRCVRPRTRITARPYREPVAVTNRPPPCHTLLTNPAGGDVGSVQLGDEAWGPGAVLVVGRTERAAEDRLLDPDPVRDADAPTDQQDQHAGPVSERDPEPERRD